MFRNFRMKREVKRYASELLPWLEKNYGTSEHYTISQIRSGIRARGLHKKFIALAYAALLPKEEYDLIKDEMPVPLDYDEARVLFITYQPVTLYSRHGRPDNYSRGYVLRPPWSR
jgi:hypothetical protein